MLRLISNLKKKWNVRCVDLHIYLINFYSSWYWYWSLTILLLLLSFQSLIISNQKNQKEEQEVQQTVRRWIAISSPCCSTTYKRRKWSIAFFFHYTHPPCKEQPALSVPNEHHSRTLFHSHHCITMIAWFRLFPNVDIVWSLRICCCVDYVITYHNLFFIIENY